MITVSNRLDAELKSRYNLTVSASDGDSVFISYANVIITVEDVNDNRPQ